MLAVIFRKIIFRECVDADFFFLKFINDINICFVRFQPDQEMIRNGLAFHPELTGDTRIHEYFLSTVEHHISGLQSDNGIMHGAAC